MKAIVNSDMKVWWIAAMALLTAALSAGAEQAPAAAAAKPPQITTVVVPIVGNVTGANDVRWKTDVMLRNDQGSELTVWLTLPCAPGEPFQMFMLAPGQSQRFDDVVAEAFGVETALSPLLVNTEGPRSVTVNARVYGTRGTEVFPAHLITISYGPTWFAVRALPNLSFSDEYRTNIGLANLGDTTADVTLALQRVAGRNVAVNRLRLPPNTMWHTSIQSLFPLITKGDHFTLIVESTSQQTYCYGVVVENSTNAALFIAPLPGTLPLPSR